MKKTTKISPKIIAMSLAVATVISLSTSCALGAAKCCPSKKLPTVFLIGDSISGGYRATVINHFAGRAIILQHTGNGSESANTRRRLDGWLSQIDKPDVIHWNNGLHDIGLYTKRTPVSYTLDEYIDNIKAILARLQQTGAKIIFATTTPMDDNYDGKAYSNERIDKINTAARAIMTKENITINDLNAVVAADKKGIFNKDLLHYKLKGYLRIGKAVAEAIEAKLPANTPTAAQAKLLPSLLILGDGFSAPRYFPYISKALAGRARVFTSPEDLHDSAAMVKNLDTYLKIIGKVDVIHFSVGFVDLVYNGIGREKPVPLKEYLANLKVIIAKLRKSGAKIVWGNAYPVSTPFNPEKWTWNNDEIKEYNDAADKLMASEGIPINDIYSAVNSDLKGNMDRNSYYLSPKGAKLCAEGVLKIVEPLLMVNAWHESKLPYRVSVSVGAGTMSRYDTIATKRIDFARLVRQTGEEVPKGQLSLQLYAAEDKTAQRIPVAFRQMGDGCPGQALVAWQIEGLMETFTSQRFLIYFGWDAAPAVETATPLALKEALGQVQEGNLISNGGFEQPGENNKGALGWSNYTMGRYGGDYKSEFVQDKAAFGKRCLRIEGSVKLRDGRGGIQVSSAVRLTSGQGYELSFWSKTSGTNSGSNSDGYIYMLVKDADGKSLKRISMNEKPLGDHDWRQRQWLFTAGKAVSAVPIFCLIGNQGTMWIDDVRLVPLSEEEYVKATVPPPDLHFDFKHPERQGKANMAKLVQSVEFLPRRSFAFRQLPGHPDPEKKNCIKEIEVATYFGQMLPGQNDAEVSIQNNLNKSVDLSVKLVTGWKKPRTIERKVKLGAGKSTSLTFGYVVLWQDREQVDADNRGPEKIPSLPAGGSYGPPIALTVSDSRGGVIYELKTRPKWSEALTVALARHRYEQADGIIRPRVRMEVSRKLLEEARLEVVLRSDSGEEIASDSIKALGDHTAQMQIDISPFDPGAYDLLFRLIAADGSTFAEASERIVKKPAVSKTARVPIHINNESGVFVESWPMTVGVPLPEGILPEHESSRLLLNGKEVDCQMQTTARWLARDGTVRWALLDFEAEVPGAGVDYELEIGPGVQRAAVESSLHVETTDNAFIVDTGVLRFVVNRRKGTFIDKAWLDLNGDGEYWDEETVVGGKGISGSLVADQNGKTFLGQEQDPSYKATLEELGPMRVCIKLEGWHRAGDGTKLCRYIMRLYAYAGQKHIKVFHTWIFTADSWKVQISDLAVRVPFAEEVKRYVVGLSDDNAVSGKAMADGIVLLQDDSDHFKLLARTGNDLTQLQEGKQSGGWIAVVGERVGMLVHHRNWWQLYPKEFDIDWSAKAKSLGGGSLGIHFWPAHGYDYKIKERPGNWGIHHWPLSEGKLLELSPLEYCERAVREDSAHNRSVRGINGMGVAKTHEFDIAFFPATRTDKEITALAGVLKNPPLAVVDPEWIDRSEAMGMVGARDPQRWPNIEPGMDAVFDFYEYSQIRSHDLGMLDFGDHHSLWNTSKNSPNRHKAWSYYRYWMNHTYETGRAPWLLYARTGDRRFRDYGESQVRHTSDVDIPHWTSSEVTKPVGVECSMTTIHWAAPREAEFPINPVDPWLYSYYLTGYRRVMDVLFEYAGQKKEYDWYGWPRLRRYESGSGNVFLQLYRTTWDEDYFERSKDGLDCVWVQRDENGLYNGPSHFNPYAMLWFWRYYKLTDEPKARASTIALADEVLDPSYLGFRIWGHMWHSWTDLACLGHAFNLTGDKKYLARGRAFVETLIGCANTSSDPEVRGRMIPHDDTIRYGNFIHQVPDFLGALGRAEEDVAVNYPSLGMSLMGDHEIELIEREDTDISAEIEFSTDWKIVFRLRDPDGIVVSEVYLTNETPLDGPPYRKGPYVLSAPADGKKGDYIFEVDTTGYVGRAKFNNFDPKKVAWANPDPEDPSVTTTFHGKIRRAFVRKTEDRPFSLLVNAYDGLWTHRAQLFVYPAFKDKWLTYAWASKEGISTNITLRKDRKTGRQKFHLVTQGHWTDFGVRMKGVDKMVWEMPDRLGCHTGGGRHYFVAKPGVKKIRIKNRYLKPYILGVGDCPVQDGNDLEIERIRGEKWTTINLPPGMDGQVLSVRRYGEGLLKFKGIYPYFASNRDEFFIPKVATYKK